MSDIGRILALTGAILLIVGLALVFADRIPFLGKLPGDFVIKRKNVTIYLPLATSILLSLIITVILNLVSRR